jgi:hypothetical protein
MSATQRTIRPETALRAPSLRLDGAVTQWTSTSDGLRPTPAIYLAVGLVAGAVVALQIAVMRVFAIGNWAHVGSLVVSLAMLGFGLTGAVMCTAKGWFERNWQWAAALALMLFGPLVVAAHLLARRIPVEAMFPASDPALKLRLFASFILYMLPFLAGALFLGIVFLKARRVFGRVYFADLTGSGLCGLLILGAMSVITPHSLLIVPLLLWLVGGAVWFRAMGQVRAVAWIGLVAVASIGLYAAGPLGGSPAPVAADAALPLRAEWSRALAWAILAVASIAALSLVVLPLVYGWRTILSRNPGKLRTIGYFACLGAGYVMVEVGLIAQFSKALGNATISASVLITGMLVFSGLGSLASERYLDRARTIMPKLFLAIGAMLIGYGLALDHALEWIGALPYILRLVVCFVLILPPAFLMGLPMPIAMAWLSRLGKDHMFLWAWSINGCFAVVGAALVPVIAVSFGLAAVLIVSGCAYLLAMLGFFAILLPLAAPARTESRRT